MKKFALLNFFLCCNLLIAQTENSLTFSEIMFRPEGSDNEFIEIYNLSETENIDLTGYRIIYYTSSPDLIIPHDNGIVLQPKRFVVIFEGDYDFDNGIYKSVIPPEALVLKIDNNAFGSSGMSNSSDRTIRLVNPAGDTTDTYTYSADNPEGHSDEKIILSGDNLAGNWLNSSTISGSPGKPNSVSPKEFDIALIQLAVFPLIVFEGDNAEVIATVRNYGLNSASNFTIQLFDDINFDNIGQPSERIFSQNYSNLATNDSITVHYPVQDLELRTYNLICIVQMDEDQNLSNNTLYYSFAPNPEPDEFNDIIINEIMHSPGSGEPEWIELYNRSKNEINLKNWRIKDRSTSAKISGENIKLEPDSYIVITEDESVADYYEIYSAVIAVSNLPSLNNSGDDLVLSDSLDRGIDSLSYSSAWGGTNGKSLERISPDSASVDSSNWQTAVTQRHATPGAINSVTRKSYDLQVTQIITDPPIPLEGENITIEAKILNTGYNEAEEFMVNFYSDTDRDSISVESELVGSEYVYNLAASDSIIVSSRLTSISAGEYYIIINIVLAEDQFTEDNTGYLKFTVYKQPAEFNDVVINEIMYKPPDDEPEWIELYNNSDREWDLQNWLISDKSSSTVIFDSLYTMTPGDYIVLCEDESITDYYFIDSPVRIINLPSLNNSGDNIKLADQLGNIIDSVNYKSNWGGSNGTSLERILPDFPSNDSTNWKDADSSARATPGRLNSVTPREHDLTISDFYLTDEFAVVGKSLNAEVVIKNAGLTGISNASLDLVNATGSNIQTRHITNLGEISPGDSAVIEFEIDDFVEGLNNYRLEVTPERDDNYSNNSYSISFIGIIINDVLGDIIVNEIMYAPSGGEPEWIEIYNRSNKIIDLEQYKIADKSDTVIAVDSSLIISPGSFQVLAKDSSFADFYTSADYLVTDFPNLNNTGDKLLLLNYINAVIDSFTFSSTWGGRNGLSLERKDPLGRSDDSTNWTSAQMESGGTPGVINSVSRKEIDIAVTDILFTPEYPFAGEKVRISAGLKNVGKTDVTCKAILYENVSYDSLTAETSPSDQIDNISLASGDSLVTEFNYELQNLTGPVRYLVIAETENNDQDTGNNYFERTLRPGYSSASLIINEVHFNPSDGEPEWFELFNNSEMQVNLAGWTISDILTTPKRSTLTTNGINLNPKQFIVVTKDSSVLDYHSLIPCNIIRSDFANLNNDKDGLVLKDANGNKIDSMIYTSPGRGYSLERAEVNRSSLDTSNWKLSVDIEKSTPGRMNSIVPKSFDLSAERILLIPGYPVQNDMVTPGILVRNTGLEHAKNFSVEFSYSKNSGIINLSTVQELTLNRGDSLQVYSSASFELSEEVLLFAEIVYNKDETPINNILVESIKPGYSQKSIIISEFMPAPNEEDIEWIELLNRSGQVINICDWSVSDILSSPTKGYITNDTVFINPGEFIVVAEDTNGLPIPENTKLFTTDFGGLGNTEDGIIIYDFRDAIIDSLFYDRTWGISRGYSLERISPGESSDNPTNWTLSLSVNGSTPGFENSISEVQAYERNCVVINEIMFNPDENNCEFIELYNVSDYIVNIGGWIHCDDKENTNYISKTHFYMEPGSYYVFAADSSILERYTDAVSLNIRILNKSELGLPNSGESILVEDVFGNIIDSVYYEDKLHNENILETKNISLERINPLLNSNDPMNWSSCVNSIGATPGDENSVFTILASRESDIDISPNPFSPDNDGFEDFTIISYKLKSPVNQLRVKVFDDKGRRVRTIRNNAVSGSRGSIIFDGLDDRGRALKIGMYIILIEAVGSNSKTIESYKKVVVVARKF